MAARAGAHVTLIGRPGHVDVWKRDGLFLESIHFQECIGVEASTDIAASADVELVLFCVKSPRFAQDNGDVYSSTARDLARGARTEIDALNGYVVHRGASRGVPVPANQSLVALVRLCEARSGK